MFLQPKSASTATAHRGGANTVFLSWTHMAPIAAMFLAFFCGMFCQCEARHSLHPLPAHIQLQETADTILGRIKFVSLSEDGMSILVVDRASGQAIQYDRFTGQVQGMLRADVWDTDSLSRKGFPWDSTEEFVPLDTFITMFGGTFPREAQGAWFPNKLLSARMGADQSVITSEYVYGATRKRSALRDERPHTTEIRALLFKTAPMAKRRAAIIPQAPEGIFPRGDVIIETAPGGDLILNVATTVAEGPSAMHWDSAWTLGAFSNTGRFIRPLAALPKELSSPYTNYGFAGLRLAIDHRGHALALYEMIGRIYDLTSGTSFELADLPVTNGAFFTAVAVLKPRADSAQAQLQNLLHLIRVYFEDIYVSTTNTYVIPIRFDSETTLKNAPPSHNQVWKVFEYDTTGVLLRQMAVTPKDPGDEIDYVCYSAKESAIMTFALSKDGKWMVDSQRWP